MKWIKEKYKVMLGLWQSKNKNFVNMYMGACIFFLLSCVSFFYLKILNNNNEIINCIAKAIFQYFCLLLLSMSFGFMAWGFYVNNSIRRLKNAAKIMLLILLLISLGVLIVGIIFLASVFLIGIILKKRAKKMDNWINFMMILLILSGASFILLYPNLSISLYLIKNISLFLYDKWKLYIDAFSPILFTIITLLIGENYLIVTFLIWILKCKQTRMKKRNVKYIENEIRQCTGSKIDDLSEYVKKKQEKINQEKKKIQQSSNQDILYINNSIKRMWLIILIVAFIATTFKICPIDYICDFQEHQSDIINVLTVYTLILLYNDKRKEWI